MGIENFSLDSETNIQSWISTGQRLSVSKMNMSYRTKDGDLITPMSNLISKYYYVLQPYIYECTMTDKEFLLYKGNVKKLSKDLYGTTELWFAILYINNMVSVSEFKKKKIKLFRDSIFDAINELKTLCETDLIKNKDEIESS